MSATSIEENAASVLLDRFETVFYAKADLLITSKPSSLSQRDRAALSAPFANLLAGLQELGDNAEADLMNASEAVLVGAREFSPPQGLGSVQSKFCYILVLGPQNTIDAQHYFKSSPSEGAWKWTIKPSAGHPQPSSLYLVQVGKSFVLVTNLLPETRVVADPLTSSRENRTKSPDVREWRDLSLHPLWAWRKYRPDIPNSNRAAAGLTDIAPPARALTFAVQPEKSVAWLRLDTSPADGQTVSNLGAKTSLGPWVSLGGGLWETKISLRGDEATVERLLSVMGLFGFGLYL